MTVLFLHDDTAPAPAAIRQIIGVERFSDIVRRKRRLGDVVAGLVQPHERVDYQRVSTPAQLAAQIDRIARLPADTMVFRLPSGIVPIDGRMFERTVRKLPHALDPAIYGLFEDEAPTLLFRDDALTLLRLPGAEERRWFHLKLQERAAQVENVSGFSDLRQVPGFLAYMVGATEARHFNSSQVADGVFRKSSADVAKMRGEHDFFHVVPPAMKRFLIPTFGYEEADGRASYAMENLAAPDAALQIVHHSFDPKSFATLLDRFFEFVATRVREARPVADVREIARREIVGKMERRLDQVLATPLGPQVDGILDRCGVAGGIVALRTRANAILARAIDRDGTAALAVSHGDPCLSNILFGRDMGLFRLIDPRGASALADAYMHPVYDVAKFSHSVLGGYDFINNGLFECALDEALRLRLDLDGGGPPGWAREAFVARLAPAGFDYALVRACELSLFLSMLPLHSDVPRKLPAFCLTALGIIEELEART